MERRISFEVAKLLYNLGFQFETDMFYLVDRSSKDVKPILTSGFDTIAGFIDTYRAPTQTQVTKLLRENYYLNVEVDAASDEELNTILPFVFQWYISGETQETNNAFFEVYEEAVEQGIIVALEIVKSKNSTN